MRKILASIIVFLTVSIATVSADNVIALVTGNDYPPFTGENLPNGGMITEVVVTVFSRIGYNPKVSFRPWKRGRDETKNQKFCATFPYIHTDGRSKEFYFSTPLHTLHTRIFVSADSQIMTTNDLDNKRICIPLGYGVTKEINEFLDNGVIREKGSPVDLVGCLRMLVSGRKDFFVINETNAWLTIQNTFNSREYFRVLDAVIEEETEHLLISKTFPEGAKILAQFNFGLMELRETKMYNEIRDRHLRLHNLLK